FTNLALSLVSGKSGDGSRGRGRGRSARRVAGGRRTAALVPDARGQVGGDGGFLANAVWQREGGWKNGVGEQASEPTRGRSRATIPGAGGDGGLGRGEVGQD